MGGMCSKFILSPTLDIRSYSLFPHFQRVLAKLWQAATMFPLVFALILGQLAIKISSYTFERGTSLGFLERLMGSRSFFSTITTQFRLWPLNPLAIGLIVVWLLSPIGSQAFLRTLSVQQVFTTSNTTVSYFNTSQPSLAADERFEGWFSGFSALFTAGLLAPEKVMNGDVDLWGNVKIPRLDSLSKFSKADKDGWFEVPTSITVRILS